MAVSVLAESQDVTFAEQARHLLALAKPRLSSLVVFTAATGFALAPGESSLWVGLFTTVATTLLVASANAFNCYLEREQDARMRRTEDRPFATGKVSVRLALGIYGSLAALAVPSLAYVANPLTALFGAIAFVTYVWIYTPLKYRSTTALFVGAIPGAAPPLMGYTAATGQADAVGWLLFAVLFVWQLPHFLAISIYLRDDYERGGMKVFSIVHGFDTTRVAIVVTSVLLVGVGLLTVPLGVMSLSWGLIGTLPGLALTWLSLRGFVSKGGDLWARKVFLATLLYLPIFLSIWAIGS